jgi:hypothetical protein
MRKKIRHVVTTTGVSPAPPPAPERRCGYGPGMGSATIDRDACQGPWWIWPRYFATGKALYACERHAKARLAIAPCPLRPCRAGW